MQIISQPTPLQEIWKKRTTDFVEVLKIVVDINKEIVAVDAEMHADLEEHLLKYGSEQQYLWGANIYPFKDSNDFIEFTSFINIRPSQGNRSMEVTDDKIREKITQIVNRLLTKVDYLKNNSV